VAGLQIPDASYDEATVNAAIGSFPIMNATAESDGGLHLCGFVEWSACPSPVFSCMLVNGHERCF
jgi:hypothetical protein